MAADNTSGFNCRFVGGTSRWSMHAYGEAIDVNPVENPYVQGARLAAGRPRVRRPRPLPRGNGGAGRCPRACLHLGRLEVGRGLRRLPALLDDGTLIDPLRPYWDFDDLEATEARFRALRSGADAAGARARPAGQFAEGDRLLDEAAAVDDPRVGSGSTSSGAACVARPATGPRRCLCSSGRSRRLSKRARSGSRATRRMAALAAADRDGFVAWTNRGLELAERSQAASYWAGPLLEQPRLGALRRSRARGGARRLRARGARARPENAAAIEHAREAVAEARKALGR